MKKSILFVNIIIFKGNNLIIQTINAVGNGLDRSVPTRFRLLPGEKRVFTTMAEERKKIWTKK